ncbi:MULTISPECIES: DUF2087 domain-containing protein [Deinococcus]|nr:DUF2087 domain-containing protein [Deinococcus radiodurans]ANC72497.1 hypothetical protein A2G07_12375 [Deinococcus radiodurans R1 = ATCC 13939 = DSM 20539]QEM72198.1 DUF2087 domain-containing protein [Deinococcus radiodurans]QIP28453.1 DUF2087 domain-containing protein [Deinococcus radiodurans]QIP32830.1 DUF2087 domain-containing protein [Deinococcus radiodurans]UDK99433.1 DUF2087 domain-containing protein [Deinococcus radiodurans R1 = ATCC 13939 = DSM 20539]
MSADLAARAALFRALSHPARLTLLRLAWTEALSGEHLARLVQLAPATVSHHLAQLTEVGLMTVQPSGHYRLYRTDRTALDVSLTSLVQGSADVPFVEDPYEQRVLRAFLRGGKLLQIPAQRKKRDVVLRFLAGLFEPERRYPEAEVNALLGEYHPDFFTLRRELVGAGLLEREQGEYWRPEPTETPSRL